jgi:inosine/xanthosine triphosphate pyrophosphatase family protein
MMKIVLADKAGMEQMKDALAGIDVEVVSMEEAHISEEAVGGITFEQKAFERARHVSKQFKRGWAIAVAVGAGEDEASMRRIFDKLKSLPPNRRWETFKVLVVLISPDGQEYDFEGSMRGTIFPEAQSGSPVILSYRGKLFEEVRDFLREIPS